MRYRTRRRLTILLILVFFVFNSSTVSLCLSEGADSALESDPTKAVATAETQLTENNEDGDKQIEKQEVPDDSIVVEEPAEETSIGSTDTEKKETDSEEVNEAKESKTSEKEDVQPKGEKIDSGEPEEPDATKKPDSNAKKTENKAKGNGSKAEIVCKELSLVLAPQGGSLTGTVSGEFNVEFWTEENGTKTPLAEQTILMDDNQELTLDSEGKGKIPAQISDAFKRFILKVPENCYYKISFTNNSPDIATCRFGENGNSEQRGQLTSDSTVVCYALAHIPITVIKEDQTGKPVVGAELQILDNAGNTVDSWTSGSESHVVKLAPTIEFNSRERYTLTEKTTPDNYVTSADIIFRLYPGTGAVAQDDTQLGDTIHMVDPYGHADLSIKKIYDDNGTNAVLKSNIRFAVQVLITNLPLTYMSSGMEIEEACVSDRRYKEIQPYWGGSTEIWNVEPSSRLDGSFFHRDSQTTCYASFCVTLKAGETFTLHDLPVGAKYEVQEIACSDSAGPETSYGLFDVKYSDNKSGTIDETDVKVEVTNILRTIDFIASKEIFGYDSGKPVYLRFESSMHNASESVNQDFIDCDGVKRSLFYTMLGRVPYTVGLIPLRGDGKETVFKLPLATHWFIEEYVLKDNVAPDQYTYDELVAALWPHTGFMPVMFGHGMTATDTGYQMLYYPTTSGSSRSKDFVLRYKNASRLIAFQKVDKSGNPVSGAHMQILNKDTGDVIADWVSNKDQPYEINTMNRVQFNSSWIDDGTKFILHEAEPPAGYEIADDIEFTVKKHEGTTDKVDDDGTVVGAVQYYYPYIDIGDGQENLVLKMKDDYTEHVVKLSKTDVGGKELAGAEITITGREKGTDKDIKTITYTTDGKAPYEVELKPGTYTMTEKSAPNGYAIAESLTFKLEADGTITVDGKEVGDTVTMVDNYSKHTVNLSKTDVGGKELAGAEITITGREKGAEKDINAIKYTTDGKAPHKVELRPGTYTMTEVSAPKGYKIAESITFTVGEDGKVSISGSNVGNTVVMVDEAEDKKESVDDEDDEDDEESDVEGKSEKKSDDGKNESKTGVKTGDDNDVAGLLGLMALSTIGFLALGIRRRREER